MDSDEEKYLKYEEIIIDYQNRGKISEIFMILILIMLFILIIFPYYLIKDLSKFEL